MEKVKELAKHWSNVILDLFFPRRCPFCGRITAKHSGRQHGKLGFPVRDSGGICDDCKKKVHPIREPYCFSCGRPLRKWDEPYCDNCLSHQHSFTKGRALYLYEKEPKAAIYAVKYGDKGEYLEYFAEEMAKAFEKDLKEWKPEVLLPVPMHPSSLRKRGFNQAEILARHLAEETGIPACPKALRKVRKTADQKELDHRQRRQNLKGAFEISPEYLDDQGDLVWKRVLLTDDVYTTGSTIDEIAKTLLAAGVQNVFFVTICIVAGS